MRGFLVRGNYCSRSIFRLFFCDISLAGPRLTLSHYQGDSLIHLMLITAFLEFRSEGHREPRDEVGSLNMAEPLVGIEPGIFRFQYLNPLGHSLLIDAKYLWLGRRMLKIEQSFLIPVSSFIHYWCWCSGYSCWLWTSIIPRLWASFFLSTCNS